MGLIKDKPAGLPPEENALRDIPDDLLRPQSHPASIRLGSKDLLNMDNPPLPGETMKVELTLYHKRGGYELVGAAPNKEMAYHCGMVLIQAKVSVEPYIADEDPSMLDRNGQIPEDEPEHLEPDTSDDDGLDDIRPPFSHNGTQD